MKIMPALSRSIWGKTGVALGIAYFLMLLHGMFSYSLAVTFDSASYIKTFGLTEGLLSDSVWYGLIILTVLVAIAAQGSACYLRSPARW